jgi:hypothetical protein
MYSSSRLSHCLRNPGYVMLVMLAWLQAWVACQALQTLLVTSGLRTTQMHTWRRQVSAGPWKSLCVHTVVVPMKAGSVGSNSHHQHWLG